MKILLIFVFILLTIFQPFISINLNEKNPSIEIKEIERIKNINLTVL